MKKLLIILLFFLLMLIPSCVNQPIHNAKPKYLRHGKQKRMSLFEQDIWLDNRIKKQTRQKLLQPKVINLDKW